MQRVSAGHTHCCGPRQLLKNKAKSRRLAAARRWSTPGPKRVAAATKRGAAPHLVHALAVALLLHHTRLLHAAVPPGLLLHVSWGGGRGLGEAGVRRGRAWRAAAASCAAAPVAATRRPQGAAARAAQLPGGGVARHTAGVTQAAAARRPGDCCCLPGAGAVSSGGLCDARAHGHAACRRCCRHRATHRPGRRRPAAGRALQRCPRHRTRQRRPARP